MTHGNPLKRGGPKRNISEEKGGNKSAAREERRKGRFGFRRGCHQKGKVWAKEKIEEKKAACCSRRGCSLGLGGSVVKGGRLEKKKKRADTHPMTKGGVYQHNT